MIASLPAAAWPLSSASAPRASLFQSAWQWHLCRWPQGRRSEAAGPVLRTQPPPSPFRSSARAYLLARRWGVDRPPRARSGPQLAPRPAQAGTLWRRRACLSYSDCRLRCVGRRGCLKRRANPSRHLHQLSGSKGSPNGLCSQVPGTRAHECPGGGLWNATGSRWWAGRSGKLAGRK